MISKKELLIKMNISYGQLYRWKREGLIPDEWFVKQSVSTGQETFFDENLIIPRIIQILNYKDKYQFDEMKQFFSEQKELDYDYRKALAIDTIDPYFLKIYLKTRKQIKLIELAIIYILTELDGEINSIDYLNNDFANVERDESVFLIEKDNQRYMLISSSISFIDPQFKIIKKYKIEDAIHHVASKI